MPFTVACAQIAPQKAEVAANLDKIAEYIRRAAAEGASLVVFPETATTGYFLEGGVLESSLTEDELCEELDRRLGDLATPIDAVIGFIQQKDGNLYNSAAYVTIEGGAKVAATYQKFFLPTYGLFDEERFVSRGSDLCVVDSRVGKVGLLICEDAWHTILPALTALKGAQFIVVIAASPARGFSGEHIDNLDRYARLMVAVAEEHGVFAVNCQLCGFEGGKGFVGGSMVVDPSGHMLAQGPVNEEFLLLTECDPDLVQIARAQLPLIGDLRSAWGDIRRLVEEI